MCYELYGVGAVAGVHPQTAYRWFREGTLPVPAVRVNSRSVLVAPDAVTAAAGDGGLGLYARVSSHDQKADLDRQAALLAAWAAQAGQPVARIGAVADSGVNGGRPRARRLLAGPRAGVVVVERRGRLGRVNTELVEAALPGRGRRLVALDRAEAEDDLVRDMTEILASFCARLSGRRPARNQAEKALRCAARDVGPASPEVTG
jgi:putative resolvase